MGVLHGFEEIEGELNGEGLEPANIPARDLPTIEQTEGCPSAADENANTPRS